MGSVTSYKNAQKQQGFTLIEFIVASILSMIVLAAVGGAYFASRQINDVATARLSVHQDLRNAANMITRDARMAGNFGCFSMFANSNTITHDAAANNNLLSLSRNIEVNGQTKTVMQPIKMSKLGVSNFNQDALIFIYGGSSASVTEYRSGTYHLNIPNNDAFANATSSTPIIVSDCSHLSRPNSFTFQKNTVSDVSPAFQVNPNRIHELSVLPLTANAYTIGTANGQQGLFRFQLGDNNQWIGPQLLIPNITSMNILYGYANCNAPSAASQPASTEPSYEFSRTLKADIPPALISIELNQDLRAKGRNLENNNGSVERADAGKINTYHINAAMRGGLSCNN